MSSEVPHAGTSRRALLARSALGAAAVAIAGCGSGAHHRRDRPSSPRAESPEVRLLARALDLEHETITAYSVGIPLLGGRGREAAKRFLDFELSHAGEIAGLIHQAGVKPAPPRPFYDLGHPRGGRDVLVLLHRLEQRQLTMYLSMVPQVTDGETRAAITAVLGSDAQHLALLAEILGQDPIPAAVPSVGP